MNKDLGELQHVLLADCVSSNPWMDPWGSFLMANRDEGRFRSPTENDRNPGVALVTEERNAERTRIARDLHNTLLQAFQGVSLLLQSAVDDMPKHSPSNGPLTRALSLMRRVIDEGRDTLQGLRSSRTPLTSLEQALAEFGGQLTGSSSRFQLSVSGHSRGQSDPSQQEQQEVYLIVREAIVNALRHSQATTIEADVEYSGGKMRVTVRDNGCGIDQQMLDSGRTSHWGLSGMRERARNIGAQLRIWSRKGAGTEVELCVSENRAPINAIARVTRTLRDWIDAANYPRIRLACWGLTCALGIRIIKK